VLDKHDSHNVLDEQDESLIPWGDRDTGELLPLLERLEPKHELVVRLHLGIDAPPMAQDRLRKALPYERRSVEEILDQTIDERGEAQRGPAGKSRAGGLTFEEIGRVFNVTGSSVAASFERARRMLRFRRQRAEETERTGDSHTSTVSNLTEENGKASEATSSNERKMTTPEEILYRISHPKDTQRSKGHSFRPSESALRSFYEALESIDARSEFVLRLQTGLVVPPMKSERIEEVVPGEKRTLAEIMQNILDERRVPTTKANKGKLVGREVAGLLSMNESYMASLFNRGVRALKSKRERMRRK
jgi:hypothetical protein